MTLRSIRLRFSARIALLVLLSAPSAQAQWILGADTLSARAVIDSQSSLVALNAAIRNAPNDATLRHHVGLLAWALSIRARAEPAIRGLNEYVLRGLADSSLRLAVQLDPKSARYELALGRFLRASSDPMLRITGPPHVDAAVELSKAGPDAALHPRIVLESGHLHWLQYETYANQTLKESCPNLAASVGGAAGETGTAIALKVLHNDLAQCMPASGRAGADEYERAEGLFREAAGAMPDDPSAFRHLAMLLAEKGRWVELATVARGRTARLPRDGPAWLTLALAMHRNAQSQHAAGVFDTALTHLDARERGRLFAFARLLTPQDSAEFTTGNAQLRQKRERTFWEMVTPLRSRPETDPRTEFLARVAFAELRWTVEEMGVRGADTDRGEIYIRYGPPKLIAAMRGCDWAADPLICRDPNGQLPGLMRPAHSDVVTFWDYDTGLTLVFWGQPTYGTARFPNIDGAHIAAVIESRSVSFDNIAAEKIIQMPVRLVRFRAPGDSVDVLAITQAPMASLRAETPNAPVRLDAWLRERNYERERHDSAALNGSGAVRKAYRVAHGQYLYRVETTSPGTMVAGRAMQWVTADRDTVTGFALQGFGISDLLLAGAAQPNKPSPKRWSDFNASPIFDALRTNGTLDIIWENYDLGVRGGQSVYSVAITIQRQRSAAGNIAAAVVGVAASALGIDRRSDRVTMTVERVVPATPGALADHIAIAMNDTPSGDYLLTLEITDKVRGRKVSALAPLVIAQ